MRSIRYTEVVYGEVKFKGVGQNNVIGEWIISNHAEYQRQWYIFKTPLLPAHVLSLAQHTGFWDSRNRPGRYSDPE